MSPAAAHQSRGNEGRVLSILAENPGPFTGPGTNTYVVIDESDALVIDPGPNQPNDVAETHQRRILDALAGSRPVGILVSHWHQDHASGADSLKAQLNVPVFGFASGPGHAVDVELRDGGVIPIGAAEVEAVHTPGHTHDHLCYRLGDWLFTGDHVMGGSTVILEDLADYVASLKRLVGIGLTRLLPGHGPELHQPDAVITQIIEHRAMREQQIIASLGEGRRSIRDLVAAVYADLDPQLLDAAALQVRTHVTKLQREGRVTWTTAAAETTDQEVDVVELIR